MKKKKFSNSDDLDVWKNYLENPDDIYDKDERVINSSNNKRFIFDLHGLTLSQANQKIVNIIENCIENNYSEILLITGKGSHSKSVEDVYVSDKLSKLKYSVPEFITNDSKLSKKIKSITEANKRGGGEGALIIKLKKTTE